MNCKQFIVVARSQNANSFGLYGHVLVARDGEAYEVGRTRGPWHKDWDVGTLVTVPLYPESKVVQWSAVEVEIPRKLPPPPMDAVRKAWSSVV